MSNATLEAPVAAPKKTHVYYTRCPAVPTNSSLAYQLGYLDDEIGRIGDVEVRQEIIGLDPKLKADPGDPYSLRHAGHIKALWARSEGADNRVVSLSWLEGSYPTYALNPEIRAVSDLRGKRLALFKFKDNDTIDLLRAQQLRVYESTLATAGLSTRDVKLVDVVVDKGYLKKEPGQDVFANLNRELALSLLHDQVDAITTQLTPHLQADLGIHAVHDTRRNDLKVSRANPSVLRGVVVSAGLLRENREFVVRILARHLEAAEWARLHPAETLKLISRDLGVSEAILKARYENLAEGLQVGLETDKLEALEDLKAFYLRHGFIRRDFDISGWVDPTVLADARKLLASRRAAGS